MATFQKRKEYLRLPTFRFTVNNAMLQFWGYPNEVTLLIIEYLENGMNRIIDIWGKYAQRV